MFENTESLYVPRVHSRTSPMLPDLLLGCSYAWIILCDNLLHRLCYEERTSRDRRRRDRQRSREL